MEYYTTKKRDSLLKLVVTRMIPLSLNVIPKTPDTEEDMWSSSIYSKFRDRQKSHMVTKSDWGLLTSRKGHEGAL